MIGPEFPGLGKLVEAQLQAFPEHSSYLQRRFADSTPGHLAFAEELAQRIGKIVGDGLSEHLADYHWLTGVILQEELAFRRSGSYRLKTFEQAEREVYSDRAYMTRYMNGLLMSQLWWRNHTEVMRYFQEVYLPSLPPRASHLEIGPGHGLFLSYAATSPQVERIDAWDVSPASIDLVRRTFLALGLARPVSLELVNLFDAPPAAFDSVAFSEVLEHLEDPGPALAAIGTTLKPGGRAFINAPVNSPAPDHLKLFRTPEEIVEQVRAAGLEVEGTLFSPASGVTLERARKLALAISTVVVARKPGAPNA